jgi:polysaccharide chain length determinant protein (PEP-CTERM system associated)
MTYDTPPEQPYSTREVQRLVEAPLRRPWLVVIPLALLLVGAVALSYILPPRYTSSTLILVAPDRMPAKFVKQMSTEDAGRRLQTLRQEVMSRTRLEMVARELDPYGKVGKEPIIKTIEQMRGSVFVSIKGKDAFSIEFEHQDPQMAMLVADRLTTLFMEEVVGASERQVSAAYQFIEDQLLEARAELEEKELALREYKERHMGSLPEQVGSNLSTLQRLQVEHQTIADTLRRTQDAVAFMESGAVVAPGGGVKGVDGRPVDSLAGLRAQLTQLLTRYTPEHPDVRTVQAQIAAFEKAMAATESEAEEETEEEVPVDPVAAQMRLRIREGRREVAALRARLANVEQRIAHFQARVEAAPRREQEIIALQRDYKKLSENYSSLLSKKLEAEMAAQLEHYSKGQQFRILDPAYLPEEPSFPPRGLFALAGMMGGLLLGFGLAVAVEFVDPTIKDVQELRSAFPFPVLAVIPYVKPKEQRRMAALSPDETQTLPSGRRGRRPRMLPFRRASGGGESA